ncbi:MAG: TauD/TfdA family dioxygenase [Pseudomonadota bacterium]
MNDVAAIDTLEKRFRKAFTSPSASCERPLARSGMGMRLQGIDLSARLSEAQVTFLLDALSEVRFLCIAGQDFTRFSLAHFERFANHWGAPIPHPSNFTRGGKPAQQDGATDGAIEFIPYEKRRVAAADRTLPGEVMCLEHESPAVLVATNLLGGIENKRVNLIRGGTWHTDVEYEAVPIYVSMFLAHHVPVARNASGGTWVEEPVDDSPAPYLEGSDEALIRRRKQLPLNGETAYADTAAAFAALPKDEQVKLEGTLVRRRLNEDDEGWLAPLVRTDPRSGLKALHSPVWASRPGVRPAIDVEGMTQEESRAFLDRLEAHVLKPAFRYDHVHVPGDVTIWNNYMTLHNSPPIKASVTSKDDARLLYRLSCKGAPALALPRQDDPAWLSEHVNGAYRTPNHIIDIVN